MRSIFLRLLALIYLIAFISLYRQFQGLWGDEGILPARNYLLSLKQQLKEKANILNFPTLAWWYLDKKDNMLQRLFPSMHFGSSIENYFFIICLLGIIFSFCVVINIKSFHNSFSFFVMWYAYFNFFVIEQIFQYNWDHLLMEVGFIAIFFAPSNLRNFNVITPVDNVCYYLLRFIIFKQSFSIGMHIFGSKCPYWLSINGLNFYFQSLPLPNGLGLLMHNCPEGIKKLLSALGYFIILDLPFGFFLIWRRFNIFAGQLTALFHIFITLTGNYGYLQALILVVNLANFDDYYLRGVIPSSIIGLFELDQLEEIVERYIIEKEAKDIEDEEKERKDKEEATLLNDKLKAAANEEEKKKIMDEIVNVKRRSFKIEDYDDNPRIEEMLLDENNKTSLLKETFIFCNILCVIMIYICFFKFPLNKLLTGAFQIKTPEITDSQTFVNLYMIAIFIYFNVVIFSNIIQRVKSTLFATFALDSSFFNRDKDKVQKTSWISKICSVMKYIANFSSIFIMILFFAIYFIGTLDAFYTGIGLTLADRTKMNNKANNNTKTKSGLGSSFGSAFEMASEPKVNFIDNGVFISDIIFQRFHSNGNYTGIQEKIKGVNGRTELEIEYIDSSSSKKWKTIDFLYKMNMKNKPRMFMPYLPRLDYQMSIAAYSSDINKEPWLAILLGKILEVNPVTMDLLGYEVQEKKLYYRLSAFDRLTNYIVGVSRDEVPKVPLKVKIEQYLYAFVKKSDKKNNIVKRKHLYEFLANIEKYALSQVFKTYQLPGIDEYRDIYISPFQFIPIVDILIIIVLVKKLMHIQ